MCGIGGFYGSGDEETLERMCAALSRRGPNDAGVWKEGRVGLAHTRLSIIDLSDAGHQPMMSTTSKTSIVFNGEIYNYRELRKGISGYEFHSNTDTEVILALYEKYGVGSFKLLNGMFAFALYDHDTETLFLVRDRMGKKPLYYGLFGGTFIFGSELKALMCHPAFKKEIDPFAVRMYLTYECVPTPFSIFKDTRKVQAGGYVAFSSDTGAREASYWELPHTLQDISFDEAVRTLDLKLGDAVGRRLESDVPLGVFLSGGIDSSTVAYYAKRASATPLQTFSIGFTDKDFDESEYAGTVARALGVEHRMEYFSPSQCIELIPEVFAYLDEPLADASALPSYLLASFTKRHVSVALGGDGADELFAGYPTFQAEALLRAYLSLPAFLRQRVIEPLIRKMPVSHTYFSPDFKLKKFLEGAHAPNHYRHQHWLGAFSDDEAHAIASSDMRFHWRGSPPYSHLDQFFRENASRGDFLNDVLWSYLRTYCMDEVLAKVDRTSMAHGLEVRAPFLDYTVVEFVQSLPYRYKFLRMQGKYILKQLMKDRLPHEIIYRKKQGFAVPIGRWLRGELKPLSHEILSRSALAEHGFFDHAAVARLVAEHEEGRKDHRKKLWTLLVFQLWYKEWTR